MTKIPEVDSWRFLPPRLARLLQARLEASPPATVIPFTPLPVPLSRARIALLSTAGISCPPDPPFDMESERANPMWGDPSWRRIPATATGADELRQARSQRGLANAAAGGAGCGWRDRQRGAEPLLGHGIPARPESATRRVGAGDRGVDEG